MRRVYLRDRTLNYGAALAQVPTFGERAGLQVEARKGAELPDVMLRLWGNLKRSLDMAMQLVAARTPYAMKRAYYSDLLNA